MRRVLFFTLRSILFLRHSLLDLVIIVGNEMLGIKGREFFASLMVVFLLAALSAQAAEPQQPSTAASQRRRAGEGNAEPRS